MPLPAELLDCSLVDLCGARAVGAIYHGAAVLVIAEQVLEEIIEYSDRGRRCEVGGFLLGGVSGDKTPFVVIKHFHPAVQAVSGAASLTFTHETWADLHRQVEQKYPGEMVVGWHHTHPGFGVFLSGYDLFIHRNFFPEVWQVALVVDPRRQEFGFFQWREGEVKDCGFLCAVGR
jgi:proteasome lid subunit RPN8/RPN11